MKSNALTILFFVLSLSAMAGNVDTVDVWTVKVNNETLIKSDLFHLANNNTIHIKKYSDSDTLKFIYWTDSGQEYQPWKLFVKSADNQVLGRRTNETNLQATTYNPYFRKNHISYPISYFRYLFSEKKFVRLFVSFYHTHSNVDEDEALAHSEPLFIIQND